ncbi:uncharacterized protein LOC126965085 [Leptidea sinapis]|uniref:uncharacterized protein LOC126965085 n=1 Tax=Leptidea sinapis TaxID=189913 RepID=UPI0021C45583|nr:uncharacterized protein LOC126965085 [Leptidea sinapis]
MSEGEEAARRGRGPPAPPPRPSVRPDPKPRCAPPRLIRPSEHLAIVEKAMADRTRAAQQRPPPLVPSVTVLPGPRPVPPPPVPRPFMQPSRMPVPTSHPVRRLPQPPRMPQRKDFEDWIDHMRRLPRMVHGPAIDSLAQIRPVLTPLLSQNEDIIQLEFLGNQ